MRTIVDLPEELIASLDRVRARRGCSRAALIREALREYTNNHVVEEFQAAYGLWKDRQKDGLEYERELRSEWDKPTGG